MIDPAVIDNIILLKLLFSTISPSPFYMEELDILFMSVRWAINILLIHNQLVLRCYMLFEEDL